MTLQASHQQTTVNRGVTQVCAGRPTADGAGVRLTRVIGTPEISMLDPFLLLDIFESDNPADYIGGFPAHPHRGFETVTYMLAGRMEHQDSVGNKGVIESGAVQWMTAGSGIIHSEMPKQQAGLLKGIQLWVNLPARLKMSAPAYREFDATRIAIDKPGAGVTGKVIAGATLDGAVGPVNDVVTQPILIDLELAGGADFLQPIPHTHNSFIYVIDGEVSVIAGGNKTSVPARSIGILSNGEQVQLAGKAKHNRLLLAAALKLDEPVARGGPFVMNTKAEILAAFRDYSRGTLVAAGDRHGNRSGD